MPASILRRIATSRIAGSQKRLHRASRDVRQSDIIGDDAMESTSANGTPNTAPDTGSLHKHGPVVIAKVSRHLLWFLFVLFFFSFLDRINIGFAGLTMMKDLGLTSTQFGLATTLFYIAYIAFGIPSNVVLARIGARR